MFDAKRFGHSTRSGLVWVARRWGPGRQHCMCSRGDIYRTQDGLRRIFQCYRFRSQDSTTHERMSGPCGAGKLEYRLEEVVMRKEEYVRRT